MAFESGVFKQATFDGNGEITGYIGGNYSENLNRQPKNIGFRGSNRVLGKLLNLQFIFIIYLTVGIGGVLIENASAAVIDYPELNRCFNSSGDQVVCDWESIDYSNTIDLGVDVINATISIFDTANSFIEPAQRIWNNLFGIQPTYTYGFAYQFGETRYQTLVLDNAGNRELIYNDMTSAEKTYICTTPEPTLPPNEYDVFYKETSFLWWITNPSIRTYCE